MESLREKLKLAFENVCAFADLFLEESPPLVASQRTLSHCKLALGQRSKIRLSQSSSLAWTSVRPVGFSLLKLRRRF